MKKLLEKQIRNIESELESVENAEKRIELRISFAMLLHDLDEELPEIPEGKEAIKEDSKKKKKTTKKKVEENPKEEVVVEEKKEEESSFPEVTFNDEDLQNTGIELHEEVSEESSPIKTEIMIDGINCADAYNKLPFDMDEEEHQKIAYCLTENKELLPVYEEMIKETEMSHSMNLVNLAYLLYSNDLEAVNGALFEFSNGVLKDVYTDLNDNNLEAFINYIDSGDEE